MNMQHAIEIDHYSHKQSIIYTYGPVFQKNFGLKSNNSNQKNSYYNAALFKYIDIFYNIQQKLFTYISPRSLNNNKKKELNLIIEKYFLYYNKEQNKHFVS